MAVNLLSSGFEGSKDGGENLLVLLVLLLHAPSGGDKDDVAATEGHHAIKDGAQRIVVGLHQEVLHSAPLQVQLLPRADVPLAILTYSSMKALTGFSPGTRMYWTLTPRSSAPLG